MLATVVIVLVDSYRGCFLSEPPILQLDLRRRANMKQVLVGAVGCLEARFSHGFSLHVLIGL